MATVYGVSLTPTRAVAVRMRGRPGHVHVETVMDRSDLAADEQPLRQVAVLAEQETTEVAALMPTEQGLARWLDTPFSSLKKTERVLPSLLDVQLPFPLEACSCSFCHIKRAGSGSRALAVAARRESVQGELDKLGALGLDPQSLQYEALAFWKLSAEELPAAAGARRLLMFMDGQRCVLVLSHAEEFMACDAFAADVADPQALLQGRTHRLLLTAKSSAKDGPLHLVSAGPQQQELSSEFLKNIAAESSICHAAPEAFAARAAAFALLQGADAELRRGELIHPVRALGQKKAITRQRWMAIVGSCLLLVLCFGWHFQLGLLDDALKNAQKREAKVICGYPVRGEYVEASQNAVADRQDGINVLVARENRNINRDVTDIIKMLEPLDLSIDSLDWRPMGCLIEVSTPDFSALQAARLPVKLTRGEQKGGRQTAVLEVVYGEQL